VVIPAANMVAFVIGFLTTFILPLALIVALLVKRKITWLPLALGAATFFVSQIMLRLPLLSLLATTGWWRTFATHFVAFTLVVAFSAGLFEEGARLGGALLLRGQNSYRDIISFGLGHGLCEAILIVGMTHVNNLVFSMAINDPTAFGGVMALVPAETLEVVGVQIATVNPLYVYAGILERVGAVLFHIFATFLIFQGVIRHRKVLYLIVAILAHTAFNFLVVMLAQSVGTIATTVIILLIGAAAAWYVWQKRPVAIPAYSAEKDALIQLPPDRR